MKKQSILGKIKSILPVSRRAHEEALAKTNQQAEAGHRWLLEQMKQTVRRNVALESKLAHNGIHHTDEE